MALFCYQRLFSCLFLVMISAHWILSHPTHTIKPKLIGRNRRLMASVEQVNKWNHLQDSMRPHMVNVYPNRNSVHTKYYECNELKSNEKKKLASIEDSSASFSISNEFMICDKRGILGIEAVADSCLNFTINFNNLIPIHLNDKLPFNFLSIDASTEFHAEKNFRSRRKLEPCIYGPYGVNRTSRIIKLSLVIDSTLFRALSSNVTEVNRRYKEIVKFLNSVYRKLNIFVALIDIEIWTTNDKINITANPNSTLMEFTDYIRRLGNKHVDTVQLITNVEFNDYILGWSHVNVTCWPAGGINRDTLDGSDIIVQTLAHEIAHNLGINHDDENCSCSAPKCIMWPHLTESREWSSCSVNAMKEILSNGNTFSRLKNNHVCLFEGPVCGNGFTEPGEDCDCGLTKDCDNPCCNASTCTFYANASCAIGECCNLRSCQVQETGTVCRLSLNDYDLPEYCDGETEYCPYSATKNSGEWWNETLCLENCYNYGICDSIVPSDCQYVGFAGSLDSSNLIWRTYLNITIAIIPIIVLLLLFCFYYVIPKLPCSRIQYPPYTERRLVRYRNVNDENITETSTENAHVPSALPKKTKTENCSLTATMQRELVGKYNGFVIHPLIAPDEPPKLKPIRPAPRIPPIMAKVLRPMESNYQANSGEYSIPVDSFNVSVSSLNNSSLASTADESIVGMPTTVSVNCVKTKSDVDVELIELDSENKRNGFYTDV